jgi:Holliday junction resolvase
MKESRLARKLLKDLNKIEGVKAIKIHGGRYMEAGTPDIMGSARGRAFVIECKRSTKETPGPLQKHRLAEWHEAEALICTVRSTAEMETLLATLASPSFCDPR